MSDLDKEALGWTIGALEELRRAGLVQLQVLRPCGASEPGGLMPPALTAAWDQLDASGYRPDPIQLARSVRHLFGSSLSVWQALGVFRLLDDFAHDRDRLGLAAKGEG